MLGLKYADILLLYTWSVGKYEATLACVPIAQLYILRG